MDFYNDNIQTFQILILIFASMLNLGLSFLFSLVETSLMITDDIKFQSLIYRQDKEKKKKRLKKIFYKRDKHGAALSVAITLTNVTGSSILGSMAAKYLPSAYVILFTVLITYLMLVFARTVPKIYARKVNQKTLVKYSALIRFIYFISIPILWFTLIWVKIFKLNNNKNKPSISELKEMVSVYKKNGIIQNSESAIVEHLLDLRETCIGEVFSKKKPIDKLISGKSVEDCRDIIISATYKKLLVVDDYDQVVGIINLHNLSHCLLTGETETIINKYIKPVLFINETDRIIDVISNFSNNRSQAVIFNENSVPVGIVSMKELYFFITGKKDKTVKIKK